MYEKLNEISYFPGCSLATTSKENDRSLHIFCERHGIHLDELEDWNCCGSSSAHSIDHDISTWLPTRNLALAAPGRPLMAACPNCYRQLKLTHMKLKEDIDAQQEYERMWGRPFDPDLQIITFFELLSDMVDGGVLKNHDSGLKGLKVAPYYGCMLARPPAMRDEKNFYGLLEKVLSALGAEPLFWNSALKCCGTFLTVSRPDIANHTVENIILDAKRAEADCIVTACAMCHLNLEIRSKLPGKIPIFHFSELLSLSMGIGGGMGWFRRHLIDPRPLLRSKQLIS